MEWHMKETEVNNPFVVGKYLSDRYFCDRKEETALNVTSAKFIKKYNLNSASSVQAAVKLLLKNDLLTQKDNGYRVYDFFLAEWLSSVY